jgi:arylsulfatase A-like enzyme
MGQHNQLRQKPFKLETVKELKRNVIFILTDDHRYDFMGFTGKVPWLKHGSNGQRGSTYENAFVNHFYVHQVVQVY